MVSMGRHVRETGPASQTRASVGAMSWFRALLAAALVLAGAAGGAHAGGDPIVLRIATLAPPGTGWAKILDAGAAEVTRRTEGRVVIRIYGWGLQGDDQTVVRKMRIGQIDGGTLSTIGLRSIAAPLLVLQLPLLFRSYDELERVR